MKPHVKEAGDINVSPASKLFLPTAYCFSGLDTRDRKWPYQPSITLIALTALFS